MEAVAHRLRGESQRKKMKIGDDLRESAAQKCASGWRRRDDDDTFKFR